MNKSLQSEFHTVRGYQMKKQNEGRLTPAVEDYQYQRQQGHSLFPCFVPNSPPSLFYSGVFRALKFAKFYFVQMLHD
ncbi:MAG: hypothetical protein AAGU16_08050 [Desulfitobacterium hafniense]